MLTTLTQVALPVTFVAMDCARYDADTHNSNSTKYFLCRRTGIYGSVAKVRPTITRPSLSYHCGAMLLRTGLCSCHAGTYIALKHLFVENMRATIDAKFTGGDVPSAIICVAQPPQAPKASARERRDSADSQDANSEDADDKALASCARLHIHAARMCLRSDGMHAYL